MLEKIMLSITPIADHVAPRSIDTPDFAPWACVFLMGFLFGVLITMCFRSKPTVTDTADLAKAVKNELLAELTDAVKNELEKEKRESKENSAKETE